MIDLDEVEVDLIVRWGTRDGRRVVSLTSKRLGLALEGDSLEALMQQDETLKQLLAPIAEPPSVPTSEG